MDEVVYFQRSGLRGL